MTCIVEVILAERMSQTELIEACGMKPANLCWLDNSNGNRSAATLTRITADLGGRLEISFV